MGTDYTNNEIQESISKIESLNNFSCDFYKSKEELLLLVAKLIYENKIVGFFNGKMEFGAKTLGNRSILANPCNQNIKDIINKKIKKKREL